MLVGGAHNIRVSRDYNGMTIIMSMGMTQKVAYRFSLAV